MYRDLALALLIGLGVSRLVQLMKEATWRQAAWFKTLVALGLCSALAWLLVPNWHDVVLVALGSVGISSLAYALDSALRAVRDNQRMEVVLKGTRGRSRI